MEIQVINFEEHGDARGILISLEELKNIPFEIKRVYYMYNTVRGIRRGLHAHKKLKQVLICTSGSCLVLLDNGTEKKEICLDKPNIGLVVESCIWREMYDFSPNTVLMVLASELYNESDYIRDYDEFLKYISK